MREERSSGQITLEQDYETGGRDAWNKLKEKNWNIKIRTQKVYNKYLFSTEKKPLNVTSTFSIYKSVQYKQHAS